MTTTSISTLRNDLFKKIDSVISYNEPITVTSKNGNAVIISEDDYKSLIESLYLISQPGLVEKIKNGEKEDISKMETYDPSIDW